MNAETKSTGCPVMHGAKSHSNKDWWPQSLDLKGRPLRFRACAERYTRAAHSTGKMACHEQGGTTSLDTDASGRGSHLRSMRNRQGCRRPERLRARHLTLAPLVFPLRSRVDGAETGSRLSVPSGVR